MNRADIVFELSCIEQIVIQLDASLSELDYCSEIPIYLLQEDKQMLLSNGALYENMLIFRNALIKVLGNNHQLHPSMKDDIGYLLNQEWQDKSGLAYEKLESRDYWVGHKYKLWNYDYATWIYNNAEGHIVFMITPIYPGNWISSYPMSYEEWIKSYKPLLTRTISREAAQAWRDVAEDILQHIEKNMQKFDVTHK